MSRSRMMTSVPGSSAVFLGGVVAYADQVKAMELGSAKVAKVPAQATATGRAA